MPFLSRVAEVVQTTQPGSFQRQSGVHMAPLLGQAHTEYDFATAAANLHHFSQHIFSELCMLSWNRASSLRPLFLLSFHVLLPSCYCHFMVHLMTGIHGKFHDRA